MPMLTLNTDSIVDFSIFHDVCALRLGFLEFYGRNMDAWIDCLTSLDDEDAGMTSIHVQPPKVLTLHLENAGGFKTRCPDVFTALLECAAFVNYRRVISGELAVLALSFDVQG
jgi:RNAse (barnase) inhibitor barstar